MLPFAWRNSTKEYESKQLAELEYAYSRRRESPRSFYAEIEMDFQKICESVETLAARDKSKNRLLGIDEDVLRLLLSVCIDFDDWVWQHRDNLTTHLYPLVARQWKLRFKVTAALHASSKDKGTLMTIPGVYSSLHHPSHGEGSFFQLNVKCQRAKRKPETSDTKDDTSHAQLGDELKQGHLDALTAVQSVDFLKRKPKSEELQIRWQDADKNRSSEKIVDGRSAVAAIAIGSIQQLLPYRWFRRLQQGVVISADVNPSLGKLIRVGGIQAKAMTAAYAGFNTFLCAPEDVGDARKGVAIYEHAIQDTCPMRVVGVKNLREAYGKASKWHLLTLVSPLVVVGVLLCFLLGSPLHTGWVGRGKGIKVTASHDQQKTLVNRNLPQPENTVVRREKTQIITLPNTNSSAENEWNQSQSEQTTENPITIISPKDGDIVDSIVSVEGTYNPNRLDGAEEIWIVVESKESKESKHWYPWYKCAVKKADGKWSSWAHVGEESDDTGTAFLIYVVVGKEVGEIFTDSHRAPTIKERLFKDWWEKIQDFPENPKRYGPIRVTRRCSKRGDISNLSQN